MAAKQTILHICVIFSYVIAIYSYSDDDFEVASDSVLTVEHSFDSGPNPTYTKRGTVIVQSIKSGSADFQQDYSLGADDINKLKDLVSSDGIYRVRVGSKAADGSVRYVSSFTKACALYESRLTDTLTVHMDLSGNVIGISITATTPYCLGISIPDHHLADFHTTVDVIQTVPGPVPETQSYVEKMERERAEKVQGQQGDNKSFFGKYWMYIVPVVIVMMLANSQDPNAGGGGGGR